MLSAGAQEGVLKLRLGGGGGAGRHSHTGQQGWKVSCMGQGLGVRTRRLLLSAGEHGVILTLR